MSKSKIAHANGATQNEQSAELSFADQRRAIQAAVTTELRKLEARWTLRPDTILHLVVGHPIGAEEVKSLLLVERRLMEVRREMAHVVRLLKEDNKKDTDITWADDRYENALEALAKAEDELSGVRGEIEFRATEYCRVAGGPTS